MRSLAGGEVPKGAVLAPISQDSGEDESADGMTLGPEWLTTSKRSGGGGHAHAHSLVHGSSGGMRAHFSRQQIVDLHKPSEELPVGFNPLPFITSEESLQPMFSLPDQRFTTKSWTSQRRPSSGRGRGRPAGRWSSSSREPRDSEHHQPGHQSHWLSRSGEPDERGVPGQRGGGDRWNANESQPDDRWGGSSSRWGQGDRHGSSHGSSSQHQASDRRWGTSGRLSTSANTTTSRRGSTDQGRGSQSGARVSTGGSDTAVWQYMDLSDNVHGPFTSGKMTGWWKAGHFPDNLRVKHTLEEGYVELDRMLQVCEEGQSPFSREVHQIASGAPGLTKAVSTTADSDPVVQAADHSIGAASAPQASSTAESSVTSDSAATPSSGTVAHVLSSSAASMTATAVAVQRPNPAPTVSVGVSTSAPLSEHSADGAVAEASSSTVPAWPKHQGDLQALAHEVQQAITTLEERGYQVQQQIFRAPDANARQYYANMLENLREEYVRLQGQRKSILEQWSQQQPTSGSTEAALQQAHYAMAHGQGASAEQNTYAAAIATWQQQQQQPLPTQQHMWGSQQQVAHAHATAQAYAQAQAQARARMAFVNQQQTTVPEQSPWQLHTPPRPTPLRSIQEHQQQHPSPGPAGQQPQTPSQAAAAGTSVSPAPWKIPSPADVSPSAGAKLVQPDTPSSVLSAPEPVNENVWQKNSKKKKPRKPTKAEREQAEQEQAAAEAKRLAAEAFEHEERVQEAMRQQRLAEEEADRLAAESYKAQVRLENERARREKLVQQQAKQQAKQQSKQKAKQQANQQSTTASKPKSLLEIQAEELRAEQERQKIERQRIAEHHRHLAAQERERQQAQASNSPWGARQTGPSLAQIQAEELRNQKQSQKQSPAAGGRSGKKLSLLEIQAEEERLAREQARIDEARAAEQRKNAPVQHAFDSPWGGSRTPAPSQGASVSLRQIQTQQQRVEGDQQRKAKTTGSSWSAVAGTGSGGKLPSTWAGAASSAAAQSSPKASRVAASGKAAPKSKSDDLFWDYDESQAAQSPARNANTPSTPLSAGRSSSSPSSSSTGTPTSKQPTTTPESAGSRRRRRRGNQAADEEASTATPPAHLFTAKVTYPPDFQRWVHSNMRTLSGGNDGSELLAFLSSMENLSDVRECLVAHLGTSSACMQFVKAFCDHWKKLANGEPLDLPARPDPAPQSVQGSGTTEGGRRRRRKR